MARTSPVHEASNSSPPAKRRRCVDSDADTERCAGAREAHVVSCAAEAPSASAKQDESQRNTRPEEPSRTAWHEAWFRALCDAVASKHWPPRLDVEVCRYQEVQRLRRFYEKRASELGPAAGPPRESFNRWLLERLNCSSSADGPVEDPLVGSGGRFDPHGSPSSVAALGLRGDLLQEGLPTPLPRASPADVSGQRRNIRSFAEATLALLDAASSAASEGGPQGESSPSSSPPPGLDSTIEDGSLASARRSCQEALDWLVATASTLTQHSWEPGVGSCQRVRAAESTEEPELRSEGCVEHGSMEREIRADEETTGRFYQLRRKCAAALHKLCHSKVDRLVEDLEREAETSAKKVMLQRDRPRPPAFKVEAVFDAKRGAYLLSAQDGGDLEAERVHECEENAEFAHECEENAQGRGSNDRREFSHNGSDEPGAFVVSAGRFGLLCKALSRTSRRAQQAAASTASPRIADAARKVNALLADPDSIYELVFCLLCRYGALCGPGPKEGGGFHAAIPPKVFDSLGSGGLECFASPLLRHGGSWHYCSLFSDLDVLFGSLGSFFSQELHPELLTTTLELNPPFVPGLVVRMANKLFESLDRAKAAGRPLTCAVILPGAAISEVGDDAGGRETSTESGASGVIAEVRAHPERAPALLGQLFNNTYSCGALQRRRRPFVYGLAFKTDRQWPAFEVSSRLVLLEAVRPVQEAIRDRLGRLRSAWSGDGEAGSDIEVM